MSDKYAEPRKLAEKLKTAPDSYQMNLTVQMVCVEILSLLDELEACRKDAERYRWLRNDALKMEATAPAIMVVDMDGHPVYRGSPWNSLLCDDDADSAIDAAMQEQKP